MNNLIAFGIVLCLTSIFIQLMQIAEILKEISKTLGVKKYEKNKNKEE